MSNTNSWNINSLKRALIKLNNVKQRKRLIALHNKGLASKKKGLRPRIMSNREIENHKKYIKKTLKDIKNTKIDITKKIKILETNNLTNSKIRHSNTLYRFLRERPERVKPKRFLNNFKTVENKPKILNQKNKWQIDYLKRAISRYEGNINILERMEKTAINAMKKNGASNTNIKNRKELFNRNKRSYQLKINKAKKEIKNL
jgi:Uri superfamily endonuclease